MHYYKANLHLTSAQCNFTYNSVALVHPENQFHILILREHLPISLVIRQGFFPFQNNPKNLDPSCKTDLDLWDCLERVKFIL